MSESKLNLQTLIAARSRVRKGSFSMISVVLLVICITGLLLAVASRVGLFQESFMLEDSWEKMREGRLVIAMQQVALQEQLPLVD